MARNPNLGQQFPELADFKQKLAISEPVPPQKQQPVRQVMPATVAQAPASSAAGVPMHRRQLANIVFDESRASLPPERAVAVRRVARVGRDSVSARQAPKQAKVRTNKRQPVPRVPVPAQSIARQKASVELDLSIYRDPNGRRVRRPAPGLIRQAPVELRFHDVCARMERLRIRAVEAFARQGPSTKAVAQPHHTKPSRAILGLDFGTAFTKAVIQYERRFYVVDWSRAVSGQGSCLIPSALSEHIDGRIVLGRKTEGDWKSISNIKMRLLQPGAADDVDAQSDAVMFVAAALRYAAAWFGTAVPAVSIKPPAWRLHLGLPAASWDDPQLCALFTRVAEAARALAHQQGPITRAAARASLGAIGAAPAKLTDVMPEFACQLYSYLYSAQRQRDLHALVDIGAGTTDVAFFNVHEADGEDLIPMFSARVERLGAHYLIGALAGEKGEDHEWEDSDSSSTDQDIAERLGERPADVAVRRRAYLNALARIVNDSRADAASRYPTARAFSGEAQLRLFLCGGGSNINTIRNRFDEMSRYARERFGLSIGVVMLPRPEGLIGNVAESEYHRIAVAYGLSHRAQDLGKVKRLCDVDVFAAQVHVQPEDRDATR